jgi:hypothetical protein
MITNYSEKVKQNYQGSSFLLPAHEKGGARATINNSPSPSEKILAKLKNRRAKRKRGL